MKYGIQRRTYEFEWSQRKVQRLFQRGITQPTFSSILRYSHSKLRWMCSSWLWNEQILSIFTFLSFLKEYSKVELYTKFFQKFWAQNKISKFFVKNQFCWTFRSALTLSSESLATDVNTILYDWGSLRPSQIFVLNEFFLWGLEIGPNCQVFIRNWLAIFAFWCWE